MSTKPPMAVRMPRATAKMRFIRRPPAPELIERCVELRRGCRMLPALRDVHGVKRVPRTVSASWRYSASMGLEAAASSRLLTDSDISWAMSSSRVVSVPGRIFSSSSRSKPSSTERPELMRSPTVLTSAGSGLDAAHEVSRRTVTITTVMTPTCRRIGFISSPSRSHPPLIGSALPRRRGPGIRCRFVESGGRRRGRGPNSPIRRPAPARCRGRRIQ